jgi:hypothetical protein
MTLHYNITTTYICFPRNVLSAFFIEESHQGRVALVKFVIGTTRYDWLYKYLGIQMLNECSNSPFLVVWSNEAVALGTSRSRRVKLSTYKGGTTVVP